MTILTPPAGLSLPLPPAGEARSRPRRRSGEGGSEANGVASRGYRTVRVWNTDVYKHTDEVIEMILNRLVPELRGLWSGSAAHVISQPRIGPR